MKRDQNINEPVSNDSVKKEQQLPNKKKLRSLRDFPKDLIYYLWYRENHNNIFKNILIEFGIKKNLTRFVKLLIAAAEIIRKRDIRKRNFLNNLNHFYFEYIKDIPNGPKPTLAQFDGYLYRWAEKVWPRALDIIYEYSRKNLLRDNSSFKASFVHFILQMH